jgi:hypothetical protein
MPMKTAGFQYPAKAFSTPMKSGSWRANSDLLEFADLEAGQDLHQAVHDQPETNNHADDRE